MKNFASFASIALAVLVVLTGNALAAKNVQRTVIVPAEFEATIQTTNCSASPGPKVDLSGLLVPSGLQAEIILSQPGVHVPAGERFVIEQALIPQNSQVTLPSQSIVGGLGDDPYVWLQLTDAKDRALTSELFLGRCSQGSFHPTVALTFPVDTFAELSSSSCDSPTGPSVSIIDGAAEIPTINGKLIFRSSSDPHIGAGAGGEVVVDLVMLPAGQTYPFPQQIMQGQISPDPQISLQWRDGSGQPISNEIQLGRCVALSN